jgi:hypothetical protein
MPPRGNVIESIEHNKVDSSLNTAFSFRVITRWIFTSKRWTWYSLEPHRAGGAKNEKQNWPKIKNRLFWSFWGRRCWLALSFFFFYTAIGSFFLHFSMRKIRDFFFGRSDKKHPFGWWKFKKLWKFWNFEIWQADSRICICVHQRSAWCLVRQGFGRSSAWSDALKNLKYFFACCCACMG